VRSQMTDVDTRELAANVNDRLRRGGVEAHKHHRGRMAAARMQQQEKGEAPTCVTRVRAVRIASQIDQRREGVSTTRVRRNVIALTRAREEWRAPRGKGIVGVNARKSGYHFRVSRRSATIYASWPQVANRPHARIAAVWATENRGGGGIGCRRRTRAMRYFVTCHGTSALGHVIDAQLVRRRTWWRGRLISGSAAASVAYGP